MATWGVPLPPEKKVAIVKRWPLLRGFKQESMYGFFVRQDEKKVAGVERWP